MCIWPMAMTRTIAKINKSTTIMNNFSNCWRFYFSVFLENGKIVVRGTDSKKLGIGTKWRYQKMVCFSFSHTSEEYKML